MSSELRLARCLAVCLVAVAAFGAVQRAAPTGQPPTAGTAPVLLGPARPAALLSAAGSIEGQRAADLTAGSPREPDCGAAADADVLASSQILSYYGNPYSPDMGILGELPPEELIERLEAHSERYDQLNGPMRVQPALHIVQAVAQPTPGRDGLYLMHVDGDTLNEYIALACQHEMLVFLDLQIGRSNVRSEVERVLPSLVHSNVHLALDPEFAMPPGEEPGAHIGSLSGEDINVAQALLQDIAKEAGREKVLIVHQFLDSMIARPETLAYFSHVRLVIDMDGFGPAEIKQVKYSWYTRRTPYSGIKLFFRHDPDLMTEEQVLALQPDVIIYQ